MDTRVPNKGLKKATEVPSGAKTDVTRPRVSTPSTKTGASVFRYSSTPAQTVKPEKTEKLDRNVKTEKNARYATPEQTEKSKNPSMVAKTAQTMKTPTAKVENADKTVNGPVANSKSTPKTKGTQIKKPDPMTDSVPSAKETYLNSTQVPTKAEKTKKASVANSKSTGNAESMSTRKPSTMTVSNLSRATTCLNSPQADSRPTGDKSTVLVSSEVVFTYGKDLKPKTSVATTGYDYAEQVTSRGYGLGTNQGGAIKPEKSEREVKRDRLIKVLRYFAYT